MALGARFKTTVVSAVAVGSMGTIWKLSEEIILTHVPRVSTLTVRPCGVAVFRRAEQQV